MEVLQGSICCSFVLALWTTLYRAYDNSVLARFIRAVTVWWKRWWHGSTLVHFFFEKEGTLPHAWPYSRTCGILTVLLNLPMMILNWVYRKQKTVLEHSFFARLAFGMGEQVPIAAGWLMAAVMVIPYSKWSNGYSFFGFLLLFLLALAGGMRRSSLRMDVVHVGPYLVCYLAAVALSCPLSAYPDLSGRYFSYYLTCALCVLVIVSTVEHEGQLVRLAGFGSLGLAGASIIGVVQRIQGVEVNRSYVDLSLNANMPGRVFSVFDNPNAFAEVLVMLIPIAVALLLGIRSKWWRFVGLGSALLGGLALIMTYSRASWIGLAAAAVMFVFLWHRKLLPALIVLGLAAVPFLPDTILNRILTIFNPNDSSTSSRMPLYDAAIQAIRQRPVEGAGLGGDAARQLVKEWGLYHGNARFTHAHNVYLQVWLETGLLGLIAFLAAMYNGIKQAAKAATLPDSPRQTRMIALGAACGLAGSLVCGLADYLWAYPRVMLIFWFTVAVMLSAVKLSKQRA